MFFLVALLPFLAVASAAHNPPHLRHRRLAHSLQQREETPNGAKIAVRDAGHAEAHRVIKRTIVKKGQTCRPRQKAAQAVVAPSPSAASSSAVASSAAWQAPASASLSSAAPSPTIENQNALAQHASAPGPNASAHGAPASSAKASPSAAPAPSNGGNSGIMSVNDGKCGWCNADAENPNGSQDWLNCGLKNGGWTPPHVTVDQLITKDLNPHGVFAPCSAYFDLFRQYGGEFNIPPILLASFAMQESTCNPGATGGSGEAGLMQIAPPNCEGGNNCWDVNYNVRRGAQLFRGMIDSNGGNVLTAIGSYNGWRVGMTYDDATRARSQGNCFSQNNLDYLVQFLSGFAMDKDGHALGSYFNLKGC